MTQPDRLTVNMPNGMLRRLNWSTVNMPNGMVTRSTWPTVNMPNGMLRMNDKEA